LGKQSSDSRLKAVFQARHGLSVAEKKNNSQSNAELPVGGYRDSQVAAYSSQPSFEEVASYADERSSFSFLPSISAGVGRGKVGSTSVS